MPCIKAAVPGPNIFLNPNGQKSMFEFFIKNLSDSAIAKHWKGHPKNSSELGDSNTANMPTENIVEESGSKILDNAAQSVVLMEIAGMQIDFQSSCCAALYENIMNEEQDRLFHMEQNSQEWHEARKYRITGSRCYKIYTYRGMDWEIKSKKYFWAKSFTNKYVKHGQMYEKPARESFISKTGHIVRECGMITSAGDKWLGFSPDGVVLNLDREPIALLEIKCLYSGNYVYYYTIIYNLDNMSPYSFKQHLETKSLACNDMVLCSVFIFHVLHILVYLYLGFFCAAHT
nr:unnamed protein product [Callosobruchus analis]